MTVQWSVEVNIIMKWGLSPAFGPEMLGMSPDPGLEFALRIQD